MAGSDGSTVAGGLARHVPVLGRAALDDQALVQEADLVGHLRRGRSVLVGLLVGVVLAFAIRALFAVIGLDMSGTGLVFTPRTVIASFAVGTLVTLLAAYIPARRAGRAASSPIVEP